MSDLENLKAWCHWKRLEKGASEDDVAFAKAVSEVIEENARLEGQLKWYQSEIVGHQAHAKESVRRQPSDVLELGRLEEQLAERDATIAAMREALEACIARPDQPLCYQNALDMARRVLRPDAGRARAAVSGSEGVKP